MALPLVAAGLLGAFAAGAIKGIIARVLGALGFGIIGYTGVTMALNQLVNVIHSQLGGITSDFMNLIGMAGFDVALSLIISARFGMITYLFASRGFKRITFMSETT
jgi:hypothetical protein